LFPQHNKSGVLILKVFSRFSPERRWFYIDMANKKLRWRLNSSLNRCETVQHIINMVIKRILYIFYLSGQLNWNETAIQSIHL
jgi:hypothetical protein